MTREQVERVAAATSPLDGLRVRETTVGDWFDMAVVRYDDGVPQTDPPPLVVWSVHGENQTAMAGERSRYRLLAQALCRFLNTGGSPQQARLLVDDIAGSDLAAGTENDRAFDHLDSCFTTDGTFEHLYACADGSPYGIRVVEGEYVEAVDLSHVLRQLRAEADVEPDLEGVPSEQAEEEAGPAGGGGDPDGLGAAGGGPAPAADGGPG